jgi:hypothetical protein
MYAQVASAGLLFYNPLPGTNSGVTDIGVDPAGNIPCCYFYGDAVNFGSTGDPVLQSWRIDKIVVWSTGRFAPESSSPQNFGQEYGSITLYGSAFGHGLDVLSTGTYANNSQMSPGDNPNITTIRDYYGDGSSYPGTENTHPVMMTTFDNLNYVVNPGGFQFGVYATPSGATNGDDPLYGQFRFLASNSGPTLSTDSMMYYFHTGSLADGGGQYPTGVDMNFEIYATPTPEPGTFVLVGLGLIGAAFATRRRR